MCELGKITCGAGKVFPRNECASLARPAAAGMTAIPCACLGIFMGGLLVKKLNLSALGAIRMAMLVNLISTACYVSFLFLGCDTGPVAGVTVTYGNE